MDAQTKRLWTALRVLPTDWMPWGEVDRDALDAANELIDDCSCGCAHFYVDERAALGDWGICTNPASPRVGLLTFEHQSGHNCFTTTFKERRHDQTEHGG